MPSDYCVLTLSFREGDEELSRLRISADSDHISDRSAPDNVPEYVIAEDSLGVNYIDEFSEIDGITSIQVYTGTEQKISPILLLENITYELALGGEVESAFDYLRENDKDLSLRKLHFKGKDGEDIYTLNFHGYAGRGFLDVTCRGRRIEIPHRSPFPQDRISHRLSEDVIGHSRILDGVAPYHKIPSAHML